MNIKDFHKPNTPYDISRNADKPELIISCDGKNKQGQYFGYIALHILGQPTNIMTYVPLYLIGRNIRFHLRKDTPFSLQSRNDR